MRKIKECYIVSGWEKGESYEENFSCYIDNNLSAICCYDKDIMFYRNRTHLELDEKSVYNYKRIKSIEATKQQS